MCYLNCHAQHDMVQSVEINNLKIGLTPETSLTSILGQSNSVINKIDYAGEGEAINVYKYNISKFEFWDNVFQSFVIKDPDYVFNSTFKVGDSVGVIENNYSTSFSNPLSVESATEFDKENFDFDKYFWLNIGGGDGVLIFSKNNVITGYRYSVGL